MQTAEPAVQEAQKQLGSAKNHLKGVSKQLKDDFLFLSQRLVSALSIAEKENNTVYLKPIPKLDDLPQISPAVLAKPTPFEFPDSRDSLFKCVLPQSRRSSDISGRTQACLQVL